MQTFKFRIWDNETEEWRDEYEVVDQDGNYDLFNGRFEIENYTGLTDCNGVEIYEGDFLKDVSPTGYQGTIGYVTYYPKFGYCSMTYANGMWDNYRQEYWGHDDKMNYEAIGNNYEAIGNIHENPEIIEELSRDE